MEYSYKKIRTVTYPVLISLIMQNLIGVTDTAFMGRVGEVELGAAALGSVYYLVVYMLGFGFSIGAEILMGRRNGEKNFRDIGPIFSQGVIMLTAMAAVIIIVSSLFTSSLLKSTISSEAVFHATNSYMRWRVFGLLFSFTAIMFRAFFMATTNTKTLTLNGIVMLAANAGFNYVLIFGKFGFPALGIAGAAIGSVLSEMVSMLFFYFYTRERIDHRKYRLFKLRKYSVALQNQILRVASWTMIQYFVSCGTWLFFFLATEHLGERSLAVSNMVRNVATILYLFVSAFASTGSAFISNLMGNARQDEIMPLCRRIVKMCTVATLPMVIFTIFFPKAILYIFSNNTELITAALPSLYVMLASFVFTVPGFVYFLAVSGTGNTKAAMWIEFTILSVYVAYTYVVAFVMNADVAVCWTSESIYGCLMLIISLSYMRRGKWKLKKI